MNRKILFAVASLFVISMMLTPLALATPGDEKSNEKFETFSLLCSGTGDENPDRNWYTPPNVDEEDLKTGHSRGGGWITGDTVELTVGDETFTMDTDPISVDWTTTVNVDRVVNNDGTGKRWNIRLTDVVTVYDGATEIGTLILKLKSTIVPGRDPIYYGNVVGYGTEALKGVHISGIDVGLVGPGLFLRTGTITGWPEDITND